MIEVANRRWTKKENDYLFEQWGTVNIKTISKKLDRTEQAIYNKAYTLGLGKQIESGEYVTVNQLFIGLGYESFDSTKMDSWVKNRNFPIKYKTLRNRKFKIIYIEDFWKWAEKNKNFVDFSKFIRYTLGKEPDWVENKRQNDILKNSKYKKSKWTQKEDEYLIFLVNQFKHTYQEISQLTGRTVGAISRRLVDLNVKSRPIRVSSAIKWTEEEITLLDELILSGAGYQIISERIGRSSKAIAGFVYRKYGSENLDKALKIISR